MACQALPFATVRSQTGTEKVPMMELMTPMARTSSGKTIQ